jgi:hypothetical protein
MSLIRISESKACRLYHFIDLLAFIYIKSSLLYVNCNEEHSVHKYISSDFVELRDQNRDGST